MPERKIFTEQAILVADFLYAQMDKDPNVDIAALTEGAVYPNGVFKIDDEPFVIYDPEESIHSKRNFLLYSEKLTQRLEEMGVFKLLEEPGQNTGEV